LLKVRSEIADDGAATASYTDYLKGAAVGGPGNGAVQNVGDILMKFDSTKSPSFTGGNVMSPGQVGLRVCIERRP
jgi:hypothetical protein